MFDLNGQQVIQAVPLNAKLLTLKVNVHENAKELFYNRDYIRKIDTNTAINNRWRRPF